MLLSKRKRIVICLYICLLIWITLGVSVSAAPRLQDAGEKLVIVIDPGHGGSNDGTLSGQYPEKIMTLVTARAMYEQLKQYDNIEVYMTRTEDKSLTLEERAEFAKSVDADFLFSIHYNASEYHTMFGSEVWVSSEPSYNAFGYQFGYLQMLEMKEMGLFLRGIKTKLNDDGEDYYGILRESSYRQIPAVIIEQCYVDEERDLPFCKAEEEWSLMGQADARAVAKYFGLSSRLLGIDYSEESNQFPDVKGNVRVQSTMLDETPPDFCEIELLDADYSTGEIKLQVTAADYDSPLLYYTYSTDGGETYSALMQWPNVDVLNGTYKDIVTLALQIGDKTKPEIKIRVYNLADLYTESNSLPFLPTIFDEKSESSSVSEVEKEAVVPSTVERERHSAGTTTFVPAFAEEKVVEEEASFLTFLQLCLFFVILLFGIVIISQFITYSKRRKRRRQRIKDVGDTTNQTR